MRRISWQDIESYCKLRKIELTQLELNYLLKMMDYAEKEIAELEKEEDK